LPQSSIISRVVAGFFVVLLWTMSAFAGVNGKATITLVGENIDNTYKASDNHDEYVLSGQRGRVLGLILGSGVLENIATRVAIDLSDNMPDTKKGDYEKIIFERVGKKGGLIKIDSFRKGDEKVPDFTFQNTVECKLTNGTWADFDQGKEVTVALTRKGREQSRIGVNRLGDTIAETIIGALEQTIKKTGGALRKKVVTHSSSDDEILVISKDKVVWPVKTMEVDTTVEVNITIPKDTDKSRSQII
jgi:hypothetical protein